MKDWEGANPFPNLLNPTHLTRLKIISMFVLQEPKKVPLVEDITINGTQWIPMLLFIRDSKVHFLPNWQKLTTGDFMKTDNRKLRLNSTRGSHSQKYSQARG